MRKYTIKEAAKITGLTVNAVRNRVTPAARRPAADVQLPRLGTCTVHRATNRYLIVPLAQDTTAADVKSEILVILEEQKKYVCEDCAKNVIEKMIKNVERSE